jgi:hypothetical protein
MARKKVRLVTQTRRDTSSIAAFEDELLNHFGWNEDIDYDVHAANDDNGKLQTKAQNAVNENPNVIVSAGYATTVFLQNATTAIPIIQAAGGDYPNPTPGNITGFSLDALTTANNLLTKFTGPNRIVTVLYNDSNTTSANAYGRLTVPANVTLAYPPLTIHDPAGFGRLTNPIDGFMLIPDAMFYKYHRKIVAMVEGKASQICYPERLFKNAHENKGNVKVYGHHIPATFRLAASYVNSILNGATVASLGGFTNAVADNDPP